MLHRWLPTFWRNQVPPSCHIGGYQHSGGTSCHHQSVMSGGWLPTFWRNQLPPSECHVRRLVTNILEEPEALIIVSYCWWLPTYWRNQLPPSECHVRWLVTNILEEPAATITVSCQAVGYQHFGGTSCHHQSVMSGGWLPTYWRNQLPPSECHVRRLVTNILEEPAAFLFRL
jgi:hypothetical protein